MGGMSAEEIYANFHDRATGTDSLENATDGAKRLASKQPDRAAQIEQASQRMQSFWKGKAAEAAASGATPLSAEQTATGSDNGQAKSLSQSQATTFHTTKNKVQKVPDSPGVLDYMLSFTSPVSAMTVEQQAHQHNAVSQANVAAYEQYHQSSTSNSFLPTDTATLPQSAPDMHVARTDSGSRGGGGHGPNVSANSGGGGSSYGDTGGGGTVSQGPSIPGGGSGGAATYAAQAGPGGPVGSGPTVPGGGAGGTGSGSGPVGGGGGYVGAGPVGGGARGGVGGGQTSTSGYGGGESGYGPGSGGEGGGGYAGGFGAGAGGGSRSRGGRDYSGGEPVAGMPMGGVGGVGAGGGDTVRGGSGSGPGSGGRGGAGGEFGGGHSAVGSGSGAAGGRPTSGMGQEPGPGGRAGVGPGAAAAEQQAMRSGAAGAPGRGGMMGPMGAGRGGRGGEDSEHRAPHYLQENDPDSIFGTDEKTAPPVIGLWGQGEGED